MRLECVATAYRLCVGAKCKSKLEKKIHIYFVQDSASDGDGAISSRITFQQLFILVVH
jgi:hypothetical protein